MLFTWSNNSEEILVDGQLGQRQRERACSLRAVKLVSGSWGGGPLNIRQPGGGAKRGRASLLLLLPLSASLP